MKQKDLFREEHYLSSTGIPITICRPILTEPERERRMEHTRTAMTQIYEAWCKQGIPWDGDCTQNETDPE